MIALCNPHHGPLASDHIAEMFTPQVKIDEHLSWALGFGVEHTSDGNAVWHWGADDGAATFFVLDAEQRVGVVALTNGGNGREVYKRLVYDVLPGNHPSLETESSAEWLRLTAEQG